MTINLTENASQMVPDTDNVPLSRSSTTFTDPSAIRRRRHRAAVNRLSLLYFGVDDARAGT